MTNEEVIIQFYKGKSAKSLNLLTDGIVLYNYNTKIAYKSENLLYLNLTKYSKTTSNIQTKLNKLAKEFYSPEKIKYFKENNQDYIKKGN